MRLTDARVVFKLCQKKGPSGFLIKKHCWSDHPGRKFTMAEVLNLLLGSGILKDNRYPSAKLGSFLWVCRDKNNAQVEIAVIIEKTEILAIAISAYRETLYE